MEVKLAAVVRERHEMRGFAQRCCFDFAVIFPQLGLDIRETEMPVYLVFAPSGNAARAVEQSVFVELETTRAAI
jgi:hypothetical protein